MPTTTYSYRLSDTSLQLFIDGEILESRRDNPNWNEIKEALRDPDTTVDRFRFLFKPITAISAALATNKEISIRNSEVYYGDEVINTTLARRLLDVLSEDLPIDSWVKFMTNVYANPREAMGREELYQWLEKSDLPITADGCFIAYKKVRADYKDQQTGTYDNTPGTTVVLAGGRMAVDQNRSNVCSYGLHFCSKAYLPQFGNNHAHGSRVVLVKINPADVVAIPTDYNHAKGRTWRYEVVGEIEEAAVLTKRWGAVSSGHETHRWGYVEEQDSLVTDPELDQEAELVLGDRVITTDVPDGDDNVIADVIGAYFADPFASPGTIGEDEVPEEDDDEEDEVEVEDEVEDQPDRVVVETVAHGTITQDRFFDLIKEHGTMRNLARAWDVSAGTVQSWKTRLFPKDES